MLKRVTNILIPYGDVKKHMNDLLKQKCLLQWVAAVNYKLHTIQPEQRLWPRGYRIIRREESVLVRMKIGQPFYSFLPFKKESPIPKYSRWLLFDY